jgi:RNA polymerase sigma-70 factor (ECF subfamily)
LAVASRDGDTAAFEELVRRHERGLYRFARNLLGDPEKARDLEQETWVRAFTSLARFRPERSFVNWLYGIAAHVAADWLRQEPELVSLDQPSPQRDQALAVPDGDPAVSPERAYERQELAEKLALFLRQLPPPYRIVAVLRWQREMKLQEIAGVLGVRLATVDMRLRRARQMLRDRLREEYGEAWEEERETPSLP